MCFWRSATWRGCPGATQARRPPRHWSRRCWRPIRAARCSCSATTHTMMGRRQEYADHYAPGWGDPAIKPITFPCAGNHDYHSTGAAPYYTFFGGQAGPVRRRLLQLQSRRLACRLPQYREGVPRGDATTEFLEADLEAHKTMPTIAFFHRPRFGSGGHGDSDNAEAFWDVLFAHHVEIVLVRPRASLRTLRATGPRPRPHPKGIRQFIVGTGGRWAGGAEAARQAETKQRGRPTAPRGAS